MSALALRVLACFTMLLDHLGFLLAGRYPCLEVLRWIGRLSFPLYVFLLVNGFCHTSSRLRYALRLAIFAVLSQIPFTLFCGFGSYIHLLNVFVTLLIALLTVWATDALRKHPRTKWLCFLPTIMVYGMYYLGWLSSDYGMKGVLMAMTFYLWDGNPALSALGMTASIYFNFLIQPVFWVKEKLQGDTFVFHAPSEWDWFQLFSLLALIPIFLYNGKRGPSPKSRLGKKAAQLGFYLFYPAHLLLLVAIFR